MPSTARRARPPEAALDLGAVALRDRLAAGALKAADLAEAAIARIEATEPELRAWAWFDPEFVRAQGARRSTRTAATGRPIGPLHGRAGRDQGHHRHRADPDRERHRARRRAGAARGRLRRRAAEGGGRADPRQDRDDRARLLHRRRRPATPPTRPTPPAAPPPAPPPRSPPGQAPLAVGTQTARLGDPARRLLRRRRLQAELRRDPAHRHPRPEPEPRHRRRLRPRASPDAALLAETLFGHDPRDRATAPAPPPRLLEIATARAAARRRSSPSSARPAGTTPIPSTRAALEELAAHLGEQCFEAPLPGAFAEAAAIRERINLAEMAKCYHPYERRGRDALSAPLRAAIDAGKAILARDYIAALDWPDVLNAGLDGDLRPLRRDPGARGARAGAARGSARPAARSSTASGHYLTYSQPKKKMLGLRESRLLGLIAASLV